MLSTNSITSSTVDLFNASAAKSAISAFDNLLINERAGKIEVADIENSSNPNPNNHGIAV